MAKNSRAAGLFESEDQAGLAPEKGSGTGSYSGMFPGLCAMENIASDGQSRGAW